MCSTQTFPPVLLTVKEFLYLELILITFKNPTPIGLEEVFLIAYNIWPNRYIFKYYSSTGVTWWLPDESINRAVCEKMSNGDYNFCLGKYAGRIVGST